MRGSGECQARIDGQAWCYVNQGSCSDATWSSNSNQFWSFKACKTVVSDTRTVSGLRCQFPFTYKGQTFTRCTTFDSAFGKPWCLTEEWSIEDCQDRGDTPADPSPPPSPCRCSGEVRRREGEESRGKCKSKVEGRAWCYVAPGACSDASWSPGSQQFWSVQACTLRLSHTKTVSGKRCSFPFTYKGGSFDTCTTADAATGEAWCQNEDGDLEDCA